MRFSLGDDSRLRQDPGSKLGVDLVPPRLGQLPEPVDVTHAIFDVRAVRPHSGKTKRPNRLYFSARVFTIDVNLYHSSFPESYFTQRSEYTVFIFCFDNHKPASDVIS